MPKNMMIIAITGTPAVGKTSFAKELSEKIPNSKIIEINDVVEKYNLFSSIDKLGSKVVKLKELEAKMKGLIKEEKGHNLIIVGHLVPELELGQDVTIVLRLSLRQLIKRLEERNYQREKIRENVISESIDYCGVKSRENGKEVYEVESESEKEYVTNYVKNKLSGIKVKQPKTEEISKFEEMLEIIMDGNKYGL